MHDYVGNVSTDAFSTDRSLAAAATTCRNGDLSTYYWPVLRPLPGAHRSASHELSGNDEAHHHDAAPMAPASVLVELRGNPASKVVPMPRFLRLSVGNPRAATAPSAATGTA